MQSGNLSRPWLVETRYYHDAKTYLQVKLYWMWVQEIIDYFIEVVGRYKTKEQINDWLLDLFAPIDVYEDGVFNLHSVSKMNTKEMAVYLDKIDIFCATEFDLLLTKPTGMYQDLVNREE